MKAHAPHQSQPRPEAPARADSLTRRANGNRALTESQRASAGGHTAGLAPPATNGFAHDFSRIPISSGMPAGIRAELAVNAPGEVYEREADHISNRLTATSVHPAVNGTPPRVQRSAGQSDGRM